MDHLLDLTRQAEERHFWFRGFRAFVAPVLREIAGDRRSLRLLDCGCGTGANLALMAPYGRGVGFDLSDAGLAAARGTGKPVVKGDITRIPFPSASMDLVSSFDVLQCVPDDAAAIREIARVVAPGGVVLLTLAAFSFLGGDHGEVWQEARRYTRGTARSLVEGAGLRVERVSFLFAATFPLMLLVRVGQRVTRPFRQVSHDSDIRVPVAPVNAALSAALGAEARLARWLPMPIGSSLLVVARRPPA
jgi:SAM-dependent methyltransferase